MTSLIGQSLGRYHILEQLGEGGMAVVYKAFDTRLETDVAVKVIRVEKFTPEVLARTLKRFDGEAKDMARLTHPNIVKVTDYGEYENQPYLVMPFLAGGNLKQYLREHGRISWQEAVKLLLPIARALEFAHSQGVIHRDVKPANILLTQNGQPMLTDFGVAKVVEEEATVDLTGSGVGVGTPEYMAPEQTGKNIDQRVDIYALGIVFYEMVTGRRPYEADTPLAVLLKQASEPLPLPSQFVRDLPKAVEKVIIKALAKKPENRYHNMAEFAVTLEGLTAVSKTATTKRTFGATRKSWMTVGAMVVVIAFAVWGLPLLAALLATKLTPTATAKYRPTTIPTLASTHTTIPTETQTLIPKITSTSTPPLTLTLTPSRTPTLPCFDVPFAGTWKGTSLYVDKYYDETWQIKQNGCYVESGSFQGNVVGKTWFFTGGLPYYPYGSLVLVIGKTMDVLSGDYSFTYNSKLYTYTVYLTRPK